MSFVLYEIRSSHVLYNMQLFLSVRYIDQVTDTAFKHKPNLTSITYFCLFKGCYQAVWDAIYTYKDAAIGVVSGILVIEVSMKNKSISVDSSNLMKFEFFCSPFSEKKVDK